MSMKITTKDLEHMEKDIRNVISNSYTTIDIHNILPKEQQPNWNRLLREMDGDILYDIQLSIPCEIVGTDELNKYISNIEIISAGNKYNGTVMMNIPFKYHYGYVVHVVNLKNDSIIKYNDELYRIISIHPKEFENCVLLHKMVGDE